MVMPSPWAIGAGLLFVLYWALSAWLRRWRPMKLITIIDGDTFEAVDKTGTHRRLRLFSVDCPELQQRNGQAAKDFVRAHTKSKWVAVRLRGRDKYRRHVAEVQIEGENLAYMLVLAGLGYPLTKSWRLQRASFMARLAKRGVHAGFGQRKPWNSFSRGTLGRLLTRYGRMSRGKRR